MYDTNDSSAQPWLLFIPQLPARPDYLRVKLRRRLQRIGAVLLKSSVYVLPNREDTLEHFHWLRREIIQEGGDAMVWTAHAQDGVGDIEALFHSDRNDRYASIAAEATGHDPAAPATELRSTLARLRRRIEDVIAVDYFSAPARAEAEDALSMLERQIQGGPGMMTAIEIEPGSTWTTRRGVKVDRITSAWLIRRFIDPRATFRFVSPDEAAAPGELRFDMFDGEFTHEGDRCTFEVLLDRSGASDPGLRALAEIVHDVDCRDGKFGRAEAPGIATLIDALVTSHPEDAARIEAALPILDGLRAVLARA
jgi:hypothetical protein